MYIIKEIFFNSDIVIQEIKEPVYSLWPEYNYYYLIKKDNNFLNKDYKFIEENYFKALQFNSKKEAIELLTKVIT